MSLLAQAKQTTVDHTKQETVEFTPPPAGKSVARFIEYIEIGKRPQEYQGKELPPAPEVRIAFQLLSPKFHREFERDGETVRVPHVVREVMTIKTGDRAKFGKLFRKMVNGRDGITNMAQMLGEAFIIQVVHNKVKGSDGKERTYANIRDKDGSWLIEAPVIHDPIEGTTKQVNVPEAKMEDFKLLIWDNPTKEQWDSLFIDGTRTDKHGNEVSRNWIQEDIISNALDFEGSPLDQLLSGLDGLSITKREDAPQEPAGEPVEADPAPAEPEVAETKEADPGPSQGVSERRASAEDILAEIGLDI